MNSTIKYILIVFVAVALVVLLVFSQKLQIEIGAIFASIAGGFAAFKSKLFSSSDSVAKQIEDVENEHILKRQEWKNIKNEFDSKYNALKARMDYIDFKSAKILQEISELDDVQKQAIKKDLNMTNEELLNFLNQ